MTGYYCEHCEKAYLNKERHRCEGICTRCCRSNDECQVGVTKSCPDCGRSFRNDDCFKIHKSKDKNWWSLCGKLFVCKKCEQFVNLPRTGKDEKHECGTVYCKTCEEKVSQGTHKCYLKPMKLEEVTKEPKYLFFDVGTHNDPEKGHVPNLIICQTADGTSTGFPKTENR